MSNSIPVVRLEVEYMKHGILHAFADHQLQVDTDVKAAVEAFCTPENIKRIVNDAVKSTLKYAIEKEIENFYSYGAGRSYLADQVKVFLEKHMKP